MKHNLEFLADVLYKTGIPQYVPGIGRKVFNHSILEYTSYSPNIRIRATRECTIQIHLQRPATITVLGGYKNIYLFEGDKEVLQKSKIIYLAGFGNSVPDNIGKVIIEGGNFDDLSF